MFRRAISELRSKFYSCLDSAMVRHDYVAEVEVTIDPMDYPARRCQCTIQGRYGHTYSREVEITSQANDAAQRGSPSVD